MVIEVLSAPLGTFSGYCGTLRDTAGHYGPPQDITGQHGTQRDIKGYCWMLRDTTGYYGVLRVTIVSCVILYCITYSGVHIDYTTHLAILYSV